MIIASIPSPPSRFLELGPFAVHYYGLLVALGALVGVGLTRRRWRRLGGSDDVIVEVTLWALPAGIIGARLYYIVTSWNQVQHTWSGLVAIPAGGLGIWGGVLFGALVGAWRVRRRGLSAALFADAAAPGVLLAQGIGRLGCYFNQELFGKPTTLPWALRIAPSFRPAGYERYATFHPTFLYELVWDVALALALIWLGRRVPIRTPGLFNLYIAGYSLGRIFEEQLRIDPAYHLFGLRLNLYVATVLFVVASVLFIWLHRPGIRSSQQATPHPAATDSRTT